MLQLFKNFYQKNKFLCFLELITLTLILTAAILFYQGPALQYVLQMLPLFISLVVMFLQANVNRYAFLLGGFNSILYALSYVTMTLYTSAVYAILVSFPLQVITFINWNRKTKDNKTELKTLSGKQLLLLIAGCIVAWLLCLLIFSLLGSPYILLDNTVSILGIVATILCMIRFSEYTFFQIAGQIFTIALHTQGIINQLVAGEPPSKITYLVYAIYAGICTLMTFLNIRKQLREQKAMKKESST